MELIFQIIREGAKWYFVTPMHLGGTLHEHITKKYFNEADAQKIFRKILFILAFCHCMGISVTTMSLHSFAFQDVSKLEEMAEVEFQVVLAPHFSI